VGRVFLLGLVFVLLACEGRDCAAFERKLKLRSFPVGVLSGRVRLAPDAQLPAYPEAQLSIVALTPRATPQGLPAECAEQNRRARTPVELGPDRGLSNVVVAASDFTRNRPRDPAVHRARIEHCRLEPQTIAMMSADRLVLENRDAYPFAPLYGPAYSAKPLARGTRLFVPTYPASIEPLACSSDAPCGRTDVVVFQHPVHAVTDAQGHFRIEGFPAAEQVTITALHPLFDESTTAIWVEPGQHRSIELVLNPKKRFVAAP
jgi:hypothetical protein